MDYIIINSKSLKRDEALISIDERGFKFGDGVFETIRVESSVPKFLQYHLNRLNFGLSRLKIKANLDIKDIHKAIEKNNLIDGFVRVSVSRGKGSIGYLPITSKALIIIETKEMVKEVNDVSLGISQYQKHFDVTSGFKSHNSIIYSLVKMEAQEKGFFDNIIFNGKYFTETSSANIFFIKNDIIYTPEDELGPVFGVIREFLVNKLDIVKGKFTIEDLNKADGVFITNTSHQLINVKRINKEYDYDFNFIRKLF